MWSSDRERVLCTALCRAAAIVAITVLAGCGFHLRGDVTYAFKTLYLNSPPAVPLTAELKRAIQGTAGARLVDAPTAADVVLDVTGLVDDKQVLSLSGGGRVREFLLIKRVTIAVHDSNGRDWLPASEVQVRRSYTFNEAEVLAREAQEARLLKEMQTDVVQQIVRRLQAAHAPA
ncbi:MAG: LPS assembly lipoprotein LptE [Betaproteobacteria bacterium]